MSVAIIRKYSSAPVFSPPYYPNRLDDLVQPNIVNTPLVAGSDGRVFRAALERDWLPALEAHQPDIVFVSAGFDAHVNDPLADLRLVEDDYRWVTQFIVSMAIQYAQGRVVSPGGRLRPRCTGSVCNSPLRGSCLIKQGLEPRSRRASGG